jgi:hypothetical protein
MTPIQKERLKAWVAALRSGEYKQTEGHLADADGAHGSNPNRHCCLGVACEVYIADQKLDRTGFWVTHDGDTELPPDVRDFFGLPTDNPDLEFETEDGEVDYDSASELNDGLKWPFPRIADAIERTFLK